MMKRSVIFCAPLCSLSICSLSLRRAQLLNEVETNSTWMDCRCFCVCSLRAPHQIEHWTWRNETTTIGWESNRTRRKKTLFHSEWIELRFCRVFESFASASANEQSHYIYYYLIMYFVPARREQTIEVINAKLISRVRFSFAHQLSIEANARLIAVDCGWRGCARRLQAFIE